MFAYPGTRMLLASDGSTTALLQAAANGPVRVVVREQYETTGAGLPSGARAALLLAPDTMALIRRSALYDEHGRCVSVNEVVAVCHQDPVLGPLVTDTTRPLGRNLADVGLRRRVLETGLTVWPEDRQVPAAAYKTYVLLDGDQPVLHINETFNPELIKPDLQPGASDAAGSWTPGSRRNLPDTQQPDWPDSEGVECDVRDLARLPAIVPPREARHLLSLLARATDGDGFVIQAGDCAETFDALTTDAVVGRYRLLTTLAHTLQDMMRPTEPVVAIGCWAGQYAQPRSQATETTTVHGRARTVLSYCGDMVNEADLTVRSRTPDPQRLRTAYFHSAATLHALRCLDPAAPGSMPLFTSHEALILPYEEALTRRCETTGLWYATSAHTVWIGERTNDPAGAHVHFAAGIANPVAVMIGPTATPEQLVALCELLNPARLSGRLTLVPRLGADRVHALLPALVQAVQAETHRVLWMCDPLHGNTRTTADGRKIRRLTAIEDEIRGFFEVHRALSTHVGGLHLETTPDDLTECIDSPVSPEPRPGPRSASDCDLRLNPEQALSCVLMAAGQYALGNRAARPATGR
ncbi:3-deoxy-7-phosphoheptulonate synthase (plasmid) [Embleya sp. NBC_00888]|uniref:3-deoxy-7-phosphoheptulonate synthase n=1 Tax=Embleya sp. NBC_00888 TaxID=2975960 RepID=UPI002F91A014|nr:3-deoxy-7-phosphoheptulonate synthase [Embleya sp. NBC_00888]